MRRSSTIRWCARVAAALTVAAWLSVPSHAQFEKTISVTFDGWRKLPDGRFELVFGYMNRNAGEVSVPLGADNRVDPAPADRGQPTNFLPGRQRDIFSIQVPGNFTGKFVWTLVYAGTTQTANASLDQNYSLDVGDPEPPTVRAGAAIEVNLSEAAALRPVVGPAPAPPPAERSDIVARRPTSAPISVWWSKFRGPGTVTFGDGAATRPAAVDPAGRSTPAGTFRVLCKNPPEAGCGATTARFSEPGTYLLRVVAAERSASNALVTVNVKK